MLNHIDIMGRLTRDPELRHAGETPVCSFRIACDQDYKDKDGNVATDFVDVVAWRSTAEFASRYLTKGRMVVVSGRLQIREWTDKDGNKRYSTEVVANNVYFADSRQKDADGDKSDGYSAPPEGFVPDFDADDDGDLPY